MNELISEYGGGRVPLDEVQAANTMSEAEVKRELDRERDAMRELMATTHQKAEAQAVRRLHELTLRAGVPERYSHVALDNRHLERLEKGRGLYLCGPLGTGKTWRACGVARGWISEHGPTARFVSTVAMLSDIRAAISDGRGEERVTALYARARLLVLDDIGKEPPTEWGLAKLFDVVDRRYGGMRPTVYTSQHTVSHLAEHLASRGDDLTAGAIVSRIVETTDTVSVTGADRRLRRG